MLYCNSSLLLAGWLAGGLSFHMLPRIIPGIEGGGRSVGSFFLLCEEQGCRIRANTYCLSTVLFFLVASLFLIPRCDIKCAYFFLGDGDPAGRS
jgi:hypothetical protein